jgi:predicted RNase H-like nuclease (RuvC/YqgF family)
MGIVEVARDALKEIPLSEVLRERVSLALDRLAEAERKIETLQMENGGLKSQLERERVDNEQTKKELQRLKEQLREDIRVVH